MRTVLRSALAAAAVLTVAPLRAPAQTGGAPHLEQLMTAAERDETGVSSLRADQRAALDAWFQRQLAIQSAPAAPARPSAAPYEVYPRSTRFRFHVADVVDDGSFVTLDDGTSWEVYLPDRTSTSTWQRGDLVVLRDRPASVGSYEYVLINAGGRGSASAKLGAPDRFDDSQGPVIPSRLESPRPRRVAPPASLATLAEAAGVRQTVGRAASPASAYRSRRLPPLSRGGLVLMAEPPQSAVSAAPPPPRSAVAHSKHRGANARVLAASTADAGGSSQP